jgi:hypothetical protein
MTSLRSAFLAMHAAACCMACMPAGSQSLPQDPAKMNPQACIPAHQFAELLPGIAGTQTDAYGKTTVALGAYERVSPDGRYVLRSFSGARLGEVSLIELSADGQVLRAISTPLRNEAFPVQGSWRYLVDTNGDHYTFDSIVSASNVRNSPVFSQNSVTPAVRPVFRGGMDGFYAAAAELPSPKPGHIRIRSLSWPNASGDPANQGEGALMSRTIEVDVQRHRITADSGTVFHCRERVAQDGSLYALPMISVDGREFAALPQTPVQGKQTMRIFGFGDSVNGMASQAEGRGCELKEAFDFSSGKAIFGFSNAGQKANLAWEYNGQAFWYSRELERPFNIAPFELQGRATGQDFELLASAFPGITKDGRVIYGATLKDCTRGVCRERAGYMISDPYQSNAYRQFMLTYKAKGHEPVRQQCITEGDVMRERAAWEATIKP